MNNRTRKRKEKKTAPSPNRRFSRKKLHIKRRFDSRYSDRQWIPSCVQTELHKNHDVFGHCTQRADEPWQIGEKIVFVGGVAEDLAVVSVFPWFGGVFLGHGSIYPSAIGQVAQDRENEEQKGETVAGFLTIVLPNLR